MKLIYLKSALKCNSFDVTIDQNSIFINIKILFFRVSVTIEPGSSLLQFVTTNCLISVNQKIVGTNYRFRRLLNLNINFGFLLNAEEVFQDGTNIDDVKANCPYLGKTYCPNLTPFSCFTNSKIWNNNWTQTNFLKEPIDVLELIVQCGYEIGYGSWVTKWFRVNWNKR